MGLYLSGSAQTVLSGGVINKYIDVVSIDATDMVTVSNANDFSVGDTVLVIQMKGLEINIVNEPNNFGTPQNVYTTGKYEFIIIESVNYGTNQITFGADMINNYDPAGAVQLVRVPGYDNAIITGDLNAEPWDSANGYGGVFALIVGNTLTMDADIDLSEMGFKGGDPVNGDDVCSSTDNSYEAAFFDITSQKAGYKGEGAASFGFPGKVPLSSNYAKGRGAMFQGGGGGNGKHSGGGGGGNMGGGGIAGDESSTCTTNDVGGKGGKNIRSFSFHWPDSSIVFLGGGGGSGTYTGVLSATTGGNGGGIVIIITDTLVALNDPYIRANGGDVIGTANASGAGGGAGGSILLEVDAYKNTLHVEAEGGNGGNTNGSNCTGAGGGGGGGLFWYSNTPGINTVDTSFTGGPAGLALSGGCIFQNSSPGEDGGTQSGLQIVLTGFLFNSVFLSTTGQRIDTICEGDIPVTLIGTNPKGGVPGYSYQWESSTDRTSWTLEGTGKDFIPSTPLNDTTYYRRIVTDNSVPQLVDISKVITIIVQPSITNNTITYNDSVCSGVIPDTVFATPKTPSGGDGSYSYYWEKSEDGGNVWTLLGGETDYFYVPPIRNEVAITEVQFRRIVSSGIGCDDTSTVAILNYLPVLTNQIVSDQEICDTDIPVLLITDTGNPVTGGSGSYTFRWYESTDGINYGGVVGTSENYQPPALVHGTAITEHWYYRREIISSACADVSAAVDITVYPLIAGNTIAKDTTICINTTPDTFTGNTFSGGDGTYAFEWLESQDDGLTYNSTGVITETYNAGDINVRSLYKRVITSNACVDTSVIPVTIDIHPEFDASISDSGAGQDTVCNGGAANVSIALTNNAPWDITVEDDQGVQFNFTSVGASPYEALVDVNTNFSGSEDNKSVLYTLYAVTDQWGCPVRNMSGTGTIVSIRPPVADAGADSEVCGFNSNMPATLNFGTGIWSGPADITFTDPANPQSAATTINEGIYLLTWTASNGICPDISDETSFTFWEPPTLAVIIPRNDTTLEAFANEINLQAEITGGLVGEILWSSTGGALFSPPNDQYTNITNLNWGENLIQLAISNGSCPDETDEIIVTVLESPFIPKGISPRATIGQNDFFNIENIGNVENEFVIFSRSGNIVFKTKNFMRDDNFPLGWDGTDKHGNPLPDDTYYYVLKVKGNNPRTFTGYIVIKGSR